MGGLINPYARPPPFYGTWENPIGMGVKKKEGKKRRRFTTRQKQSIQFNPTVWSDFLRFINKALSNIDLMNWIDKLKIRYFRGIFSRDNLPCKILKKECGIINLDSKIGPGTHWVCYRNIDKYCEYFDPFGLIMPSEVQTYLSSSRKQIIYSGDKLQERDSVLCGYWCLYYLYERHKGKTILETIHNPIFNINDRSIY